MTIQHEPAHAADSPDAFVFAQLFGWSCSICAPLSWPKERVEAFAKDATQSDGWQSVNLVTLFGQRHNPTPTPCNQAPTKRQHWFLLRDK